MSLRFTESGGQYHITTGMAAAGIWGSTSGNAMTSSAQVRNGSTYAYGTNVALTTKNLSGTGFNGMVAGYAIDVASATSALTMIQFLDGNNGNAVQCDTRISATGQVTLTRNGTVLATSAGTITTGWHYVELKAAFATGATGSIEARVDGAVFVTASSVQTATTTAKGSVCVFRTQNITNSNCVDFYVCDTDTSNGSSNPNNNYLGDITVAEIYGNGAGVNSQWSQATNNAGAGSPPPFAISSVTGGTAFTRTVTATGETAGAYIGYYFTTSGFTGSNGTFLCTNSSTTTITLSGSSLSGSGTLAFQCIVQIGVHGGVVDGFATANAGTRPNGDAAYITDGTSGHIQDYSHQTLSLTGTIFGVAHLIWGRNDATSINVNQVCLSGSATETSVNQALGSSYGYFTDIVELDPNLTTTSFTTTTFNNATFGVKVT